MRAALGAGVGVAISTFRRPEMLHRAIEAWDEFMPEGAVIRVVRDSEPPQGVAATKNRCIKALFENDAIQHMFLVDDDTWPKHKDWWRPYVEDPEPHLMLCWGRRRLISKGQRYTVWSHPRGCMLYVERRVVERVGGMRLDFGRYGSEHVEWSKRIHNAGLTKFRYADLVGSTTWWHSEDMGRPGETNQELGIRRQRHSTLGSRYLADTADFRSEVMRRFEGSSDFVEFR